MQPTVLGVLLATVLQYTNSVTSATAFNCKNTLISDEWRAEVLKVHNNYRRRLSKGLETGSGGLLPPAKDINELSWDCNIEDFAFNQALTCKDPPDVPAPPTVDPKFGVAMEVVSTKSACDPTTVTKDTLKKWWKEGLKKQADAALVADNKLFNAMAYSKTTNFACTYSMCQSRKFYLLCFYNKEAADPLYAAGALPDYCNKCDPNTVTCINGLCAPPYELTNVAKSTYCPNCQGKFSDYFRETAINMHNYYRRLLAMGWAKNGDGYAQPGRKMIQLTYDDALETEAETEAKLCGDKPTAATAEGESFWKTNDFNMGHEEAMMEAMKEWWSPLEKAKNLGDNPTYTAEIRDGPLKYFANIAYEQTTKIGCAVETCTKQGRLVIDCRYNTLISDDEVIYTTGKVCSKCRDTADTTQCSALGGLCVKPP